MSSARHVRGSIQVTYEQVAQLNSYPVTVKYDDCVGGCEVDPKTTSSSAQEEEEHLRIRRKLLHLHEKNENSMKTTPTNRKVMAICIKQQTAAHILISVCVAHWPIQSAVLITTEITIIHQNI